MTKSSLRSQFKATSAKNLQKEIAQDDKMLGVNNNQYLQLVDGKQLKIRIFPAHPGVENFYIRSKKYWLGFQGDDGEMHRGTVYDSRVHGGTEFDLIDEYIKFAKNRFAEDDDKMERLSGGFGSKYGKTSLRPTFSWICYADVVQEDNELKAKIWEFGKTVRDALNRLAMSEDEDEPIEVDPFTDPDEGLPVLVKYLKTPNKKAGEENYSVSFGKKPKARPLTDEELKAFQDVKPLTEVIPKYGMRQFDKALEGLQNWDQENEFGLFEDDEWLEVVEKVKAQYDAPDDEEEEKSKKTAKKTAPKPKKKAEPEPEEEEPEEEEEPDEPEEEEEPEDDEYDDMDRNELKRYIKKNGLDIVVRKSMSDDDIRNAIREAVKADDDEEEEEPEEEEEEPEAEEETEEEDAKPKTKLTLAQIRAKLKEKK